MKYLAVVCIAAFIASFGIMFYRNLVMAQQPQIEGKDHNLSFGYLKEFKVNNDTCYFVAVDSNRGGLWCKEGK